MKKNLFKLLTCSLSVVACMTIVACGGGGSNNDNSGDKPSGSTLNKPVDGSPILFDETLNYYSTDPSVIVDGNVKYVFYTVNSEEKGGKATVAVRKATKSGDAWTYGEKKTVIAPSASGFDSYSASNADVVKGSFAYNGKTYSYLMAYQGCDNANAKNHKIGFAVADAPDGEWVKVENLTVESAVPTAYGVAQPSLINYDKQNKIVLCYSHDWGDHTGQMLREVIVGEGSALVVGPENALATDGLKDGADAITFNNADFAYDSTSGYLYVVRDFNPVADKGCKLNTAVQVAKIPFADLFTDTATWEIVDDKVNWKDLRDKNDVEKMGWVYAYSACIQADAYGFVDGAKALDLAVTVTSYDESTLEYLYYQTITECTVAI